MSDFGSVNLQSHSDAAMFLLRHVWLGKLIWLRFMA